MNRIKKSKNQLHEMKDKELKVDYVNHVSISSTNDEYILDFFLAAPPRAILVNRVAMNLSSVKTFVKNLSERLENQTLGEDSNNNSPFHLVSEKVEA
mgnify:FL=1